MTVKRYGYKLARESDWAEDAFKAGWDAAAEHIEKLEKALELAEEPLKWFSADYPNDGEMTSLAHKAKFAARDALATLPWRQK